MQPKKISIKEKQVLNDEQLVNLLKQGWNLTGVQTDTIINTFQTITPESDIIQYTHTLSDNAFFASGGHALNNQEIQKSSDDGEPQKTAGFPMLEVLKKQNMTYVLAVVVRYFGGIKLGAGGLIRAYASSVKDAIKRAIVTNSALYQQCSVAVNYGLAGGLEFYLRSLTDNVEKVYGGDIIILKFVVLDKDIEKISEMVKKLSNFQSQLVKDNEVIRYI